jgi:hypothetical protein
MADDLIPGNPVEQLTRWRKAHPAEVDKKWPKGYLATPAEQHELAQIANPADKLTRFRQMRDAAAQREAQQQEGGAA